MGDSRHAALSRMNESLHLLATLILLTGLFAVANWDHGLVANGDDFLAMRVTLKNTLLIGVFLILSAVSFHWVGLYDFRRLQSLGGELAAICKASILPTSFLALFPLVSDTGAFGFDLVLFFLLSSIPLALVGRFFGRFLFVQLLDVRHMLRRVIIVGSGPRAAQLRDKLLATDLPQYQLEGFVDTLSDSPSYPLVDGPLLGTVEDLEKVLIAWPVDEVLVALPIRSCYERIQTAIQTCEGMGVDCCYLSDVFRVSLARSYYDEEAVPSVALSSVARDYRQPVKRTIDIVGAAFGLALLSPLMLVVAIAIKSTSDGPVLFRQDRVGKNRRRFRMYKFRTMVRGAESLRKQLEANNEMDGPVFKIRNDPRLTSVGRLLRKTSVDELPQLINVLRGDMSLVGPRPLPVCDVDGFDRGTLMRRFSMKPGITCLWQVSGRSNTSFSRWIALDLHYVENWSLRMDLQILLRTVPAVLRGDGAV